MIKEMVLFVEVGQLTGFDVENAKLAMKRVPITDDFP